MWYESVDWDSVIKIGMALTFLIIIGLIQSRRR
jgi:hypothetical protein